MKFLLCFGIMLAFVTERALSQQQYLLGKLPIQSDGRNFGGIFDPVLTRVSSLETSVAPLTSGFPTLQNQIATLQSQVSPLQSLQSQVTNLQSQVLTLQNSTNQIATLQSQVSSLQNSTNQIATLQSQLSSLQTLTNQLNTSLVATNTKLAADEITIAAAQANITSLNAQLIAATAAAATANTTANLAQTAANNAQNAATAAQTAATAAAAPKCSSTTPSTAQIVSGKCYQVFSNALSFTAAKDACTAGGGKLAEPATAADAVALWTALKTAFPTETTAIGTATNPGVWLGFTQGIGSTAPATTAFAAISNPGVTIAVASFKTTPILGATAATYNNAALLDTPTQVATTPFISLDSTVLTNTRAFICQY